MFVVEHQVWTFADTVTSSPATGLLLVQGRPAARRTATVRGVAAALDELLSDRLAVEIPIRPVLAVDGTSMTG